MKPANRVQTPELDQRMLQQPFRFCNGSQTVESDLHPGSSRR